MNFASIPFTLDQYGYKSSNTQNVISDYHLSPLFFSSFLSSKKEEKNNKDGFIFSKENNNRGRAESVVKQKRINAKRFSVKKIFSSNIYIKHTNSLVILTLFIFNKKNNIILNVLKKLQNFSVIRNKRLVGINKNKIKPRHKVDLLYKSFFNSLKKRIKLVKSNIMVLANKRLAPSIIRTSYLPPIKIGKKRQSLRKYKLTIKKKKYSMLKKLSLSVIRKKRLFNIIKFYNLIKLLGLNSNIRNLSEKNIGLGVYPSHLSGLILNFLYPSNPVLNSLVKRTGKGYSIVSKNNQRESSIFSEEGNRNIFISKLLRFTQTRGKFLKKNFLKNLISSVYYNQLFLFNKFKFTYLFLNFKGFGLINIIEKIFEKKVEFNIISLKSIYLNSDMLSESIAKKLTDRKNNLLVVLNKALRKVKLPVFHSCLIDESYKLPPIDKDNLLNTIRYKTISGIRFEASGRLTRRLIASRSIFKIRYIGNIKNIYSSYKHISSPILRGYLKSSIQYTLINSKTRNGSFGLKGWVNSY